MKAIVSGAGIAGLTFALCMHRVGHEVVVLESSPRLRDEGYLIGLFGPGYDVAETLGLIPAIKEVSIPLGRFIAVGPRGETKYSLDFSAIHGSLVDRRLNFLRGDMERLLFQALKDPSVVRFGRSVSSVEQDASGVRVRLENGEELSADVLVGADGIHSRVRSLVYGEDERFMRLLGFHVLALIFDHADLPEVRPDQFYMMTMPDRLLDVVPVRGGKMAALFVHRSPGAIKDRSVEAARRELHEHFGSMGWVAPQLLEFAERQQKVFLDSAIQIVMPKWTEGRVALIGDAGYSVTLLAGQGAAMAMLGASVLAAELDQHPKNVAGALTDYEEIMRPYVDVRQVAARKFSESFVPKSAWKITIRDFMIRNRMLRRHSSLVRRRMLGKKMEPADLGLIERFRL